MEGRKKADLRDLCAYNLQHKKHIEIGDRVSFREFDREKNYYTGRRLMTNITHIQMGYVLKPGCGMLSFKVVRRFFGNDHFATEANP